MATTTHLGITLVEQSQAQKEVTVNQALTRIDAVLNSGAKSRVTNTPPGSPVSGDLYIVGTSPTGAWAGQSKKLAYYDQLWRFIAPNEGMTLWVNDEDVICIYDGTNWVANTLDSTLAALAAYNTNGLIAQTAADTFAGRSIVATSSGITISNGDGISGNPTLSISNKRTRAVMATEMRPSVSGGCAALALVATSANRPDIATLDFDPATVQYAQFWVPMPKRWNASTVSAQFLWSHASTTTNFGVVWGLQAVAVGDADTMDVVYGTSQTVTDTGGTTNALYISPETSAITIGNSPAQNDMVCFRVYRDAASGSDTMAVNARLQAIKLYFTINTLTDA